MKYKKYDVEKKVESIAKGKAKVNKMPEVYEAEKKSMDILKGKMKKKRMCY